MDKNIAAFMRDDVNTVGVRFFKDTRFTEDHHTKGTFTLLGEDYPAQYSDKVYTYITDIAFKEGDIATVIVAGIPRHVKIVRVDDDLAIDPKDSIEYKWVVSKLSIAEYEENIRKNKALTDLIAGAYKKNLRQQMKQVLLAELSDEAREQLLSITNTKDIKL